MCIDVGTLGVLRYTAAGTLSGTVELKWPLAAILHYRLTYREYPL